MFNDDNVKKPNKRIQPGFDWETELQLAKIFCRPMRTYSNDKPYYPWLPPAPLVPSVNFDLNYKE